MKNILRPRDSKGRFINRKQWAVPRDNKGRFLSRRQWAVIKLRHMIDQLMRGEWYADESWVQYSRNDSGYDYYRNVARLYRSFRIKHGIYETF